MVNVANYFGTPLFDDYRSDAVVDVVAFDEEGRTVADHQATLAPGASAHVDLTDAVGVGADTVPRLATCYVRVAPTTLPPSFDQCTNDFSTEYTMEIESPGGSRTFFHNTLGPSYVPTVGRMVSRQLWSSSDSKVDAIVLANGYLGTAVPVLSAGRARVRITNWRGRARSALSERVPPRGIRLFRLEDAFDDVDGFLDGRPGTLELLSANLVRKPWVWISSSRGDGISIEHL